MRVLEKNRQTMYYSLPCGTRKKYERNDDGTIKYIEIDGEIVPKSAGEIETKYSRPVQFKASLSGRLNELHAVAYGVDASSVYGEIMTLKGLLPLKYGMKIWRNSPIEYLIDEEDGEPNADTADYTVKGFMDEYLNYDWLLVQRVDANEA